MSGDGGDRDRRRREKERDGRSRGEGRSSKHRDRGEDRDRGGGEQTEVGWLSQLLGARFCGGPCSQVLPCASAEKVDARGSSRRRDKQKRDKERGESRRGRRRRRDGADEAGGGGSTGDGGTMKAEAGNQLESTADDDTCMTDRTGMSYASDTDYSGQSTARSMRSQRSQRSQRPERAERPERQQSFRSVDNGRRSNKDAMVNDSGSGVKVMNLSDLRGQQLPAALDAPSQLPVPPIAATNLRSGGHRGTAGNEDPPLSARSGRSEGGRSVRSCAQSEGGMSVKSAASVSIRKYMGHLSEKKSPAEVKKMVKDFVRQMVKGREMGVLCGDGTLKQAMCAITRSLDTFTIKSGEQTRKVRLTEVVRIIFGAPEELSDLETPLDEMCSTLELESSECISFKFAERKAAELFTMCMQLFTDGQRPQ